MFNRLTNDTTLTKVSAYFTHSTTLTLFLTALGVFEDPVPLRAENYIEQKYRKFRTSKIVPYAANFAAIHYQCTGINKRNNKGKVLFLLNQTPIMMPWCKNDDRTCNLAEIRKMYVNLPMSRSDIFSQNSNASKLKVSGFTFSITIFIHFLRLYFY